MLLFWNACWKALRYIGTFSLIPQVEYGSSDCTGDFFLENSSEKLTKYVSFIAMKTRCYRMMEMLLYFPHYSLFNVKHYIFAFSLSFLYQ